MNSSIAIGLDWTVSSYVIDHKWNYVMSGNLLRIYLLARAPQSDCPLNTRVSDSHTTELRTMEWPRRRTPWAMSLLALIFASQGKSPHGGLYARLGGGRD